MRFLVLSALMVLAAAASQAQDTLLTLAAPSGGVTYYTSRDTIVSIRWTGVADTIAVRLEFSPDDGNNWTTIEDSAKGLQYEWNIKGLAPSTLYRVRVVQLRPPGANDNVIYSGHSSPVADAYWSPDNERVVSVAGEAHVWSSRVSANVPLVAVTTGRAAYYGVRWVSNPERIITCSDDNTVKSLDVQTNSVMYTFTHPDVVTKIELDPTGLWLFTKCDDNRTRVYQFPSTVPQAVHNAGSTMDDMVVNGDGTRVVLCAGEARVYGRRTGLPNTFNKHAVGALSAAFSPDGTKICSIGGDATIRLWNQSTAVEEWNVSDTNREGVRCVAFSPDGKTVAVGMSDSTITIWDAETGARKGTLSGYGGAVRMVAYSPDGAMIAGASDDRFARIHDATSYSLISSYQHGNDVNVVRWSYRGDRLLTTSRDGTARVWQVLPVILQADTSQRFTIAPPPPSFVRFTASGDTLDIGESTTINFRTEGAQFLGLADIDSVELRISYDASALRWVSSSIQPSERIPDEIIDNTGVRRLREAVFFRIPLDTVDSDLFTITLQATLGQDSITAMTYDRITQIGTGPGTRVDKRSEPILIRGICRVGEGPRLFNPFGEPLTVRGIVLPSGIRIEGTLSETAPASLELYDIGGRLVWSDCTTRTEESQRSYQRTIPESLLSGVGVLVVRTERQQCSTMVSEGAR